MSSSETQDFLSKLERPFFYLTEKDKGIYDAMNKGISLSNGDWLYFLGAGDILKDAETLKFISNSFNKNVDILIGNIQYDINASDSVILKRNKGIFKSKISPLLWFKNTAHHQSIFYKKNIFTKKKYDDSYKVLSDYDFNLFLYKNKITSFQLNKIVALCDTKGISKIYNWRLYNEEIRIKTNNSHIIFKPFFSFVSFLKFCTKFFIK